MKPKKGYKFCSNHDCRREFKLYKSTDKFCQPSCKIEADGHKSIKKVSDKRKVQNEAYFLLRKAFLQRYKVCFIENCPNPATTIEHRAGRWGENYLDTSTWAACCAKHNIELENNPELSRKYQLSKITGKHKPNK